MASILWDGFGMAITDLIPPTADHIGDDDFPWATAGGGVELKVLQVRESEGLWVIRNRFAPGVEVQTHRHTGPVFGITFSGRWGYKENDFFNTAGSYLFEPANSVHTLFTPEDNEGPTDVLFVIYGANLNIDADGNIESATTGPGVLAAYRAMLEAAGETMPPVLVD